MKPYKTEFIDNDGRRVTGAFLPIENGNVGGLEPWMVESCRNHALIQDDMYGDLYGDPLREIAAAIDAILGGEE